MYRDFNYLSISNPVESSTFNVVTLTLFIIVVIHVNRDSTTVLIIVVLAIAEAGLGCPTGPVSTKFKLVTVASPSFTKPVFYYLVQVIHQP